MRVVFLLPTDVEGKPNLRAEREAQALQDAGWVYEFNSVTFLPAPKNFLSRIAWFRRYTRTLAQMPQIVEPKPDIIIAHDLYTLPAGVKASRKLGVPLIYDSHEPWPELISNYSMVEAIMASLIENRALRRMDHVFAPCQSITDRFHARGVPTTVLYNTRMSKDIVPMDRDEAHATLGYGRDDFVLGYIGSMDQLRKGDMSRLLFSALLDLPERVKLLIIGGPDKDANDFREWVEWDCLSDRVRVEGYQPFDKLAPFYSALDVGLIMLDERPNHQKALPNKLWDYMAFGVPVLAPGYPEIARVVRATDCGWLMHGWEHPSSREMHFSAYLKWILENYTRSKGQNGRKAFLERFAWEYQAQKFMRVVEDLTFK